MTASTEPRPVTTLAAWDDHYAQGRGWRAITEGEAAAHAAHLTSTAPGTHALDVGCGTGELTALLQDWGYVVTGVDWAPAAIQQAEQKHPGIAFECADISDLTGAYDLITARLVYPVIKDQAGLLAAASRLLRPGGQLAIIAPLATELTKRQHVGLTDEHLHQLANWSDRVERYEHEGLHGLICRRKPEATR